MYSDMPRPEAANGPDMGARRRPPLAMGAALYLWAVVSLIAFSLFSPRLGAFLQGLFPGMDAQALSLAAAAIYYLPFVLLPAALAVRRAGGAEAARLNGMRPLAMLGMVGLALCGLLLAQYVTVLWMMLLEALHIPYASSGLDLPTTTQGATLMVLSVAVLPGVCEEFLFRGAMLGAFERLGTKKAIVLTAVLFTLWHGSLSGVPAELFTGLMLGYVAFAFDSVYAAITYHTVHNAAIVLMNVYSAGAEVTAEEEALLAQGTFAYMGGWQGVFWMLFYVALLAWAMRGFLRVTEHSRRMHGIRAVPPGGEKLRAGALCMLCVGALIMAGIYALDIAALLAGGAA